MQHAYLNVQVGQQNLHFVDLRKSAHSGTTYPFGILATTLEIGGVKNGLSEWKGIDAFCRDSTTRPTSRTSWGNSILCLPNTPPWEPQWMHLHGTTQTSTRWCRTKLQPETKKAKQVEKQIYIQHQHTNEDSKLYMGIRCSISNPDSIPKLKLYNNPLSKRHTKVDFMKGRKVARLHKATHSRYKGSSVFPTTSLRHQSSSHWQSSRVKSPLDHPPSGHSLKPISTPNKVGDSRRWYGVWWVLLHNARKSPVKEAKAPAIVFWISSISKQKALAAKVLPMPRWKLWKRSYRNILSCLSPWMIGMSKNGDASSNGGSAPMVGSQRGWRAPYSSYGRSRSGPSFPARQRWQIPGQCVLDDGLVGLLRKFR